MNELKEDSSKDTRRAAQSYTNNLIRGATGGVNSTETPFLLLDSLSLIVQNKARARLTTAEQHTPKEFASMTLNEANPDFCVSFVAQKGEGFSAVDENPGVRFRWGEILGVAADDEAGDGGESGEFDAAVWCKDLSEVIR